MGLPDKSARTCLVNNARRLTRKYVTRFQDNNAERYPVKPVKMSQNRNAVKYLARHANRSPSKNVKRYQDNNVHQFTTVKFANNLNMDDEKTEDAIISTPFLRYIHVTIIIFCLELNIY